MLETVYLQYGRYNDLKGELSYPTNGLGLGIKGLLKLAAISFPKSRTIHFISDHIDVQYQQSQFDIASDHPLHRTKFKGINLVIR